MACSCGYAIYTETPEGGILAGGSAAVTTNNYNPSGGVVCAGVATVTTNQPFDGFGSVYHLIQSGNGTAGEYLDSAGNLDGQGNGGDATYTPDLVGGIWYSAQSFTGSQYITLPEDSIQDTADFTVSLWAKITGRYLDRCFYSRGKTFPNEGEEYSVYLGHTLTNQPQAKVQLIGADDWNLYTLTSPDTLTEGCWYHLALTIEQGNQITLYVDGQEVATQAITETSFVPSTQGHYIGRLNNRAYAYAYIQEVRLSPEARDEEWLETEFLNLCDSTFVEYNGTEQYGIG